MVGMCRKAMIVVKTMKTMTRCHLVMGRRDDVPFAGEGNSIIAIILNNIILIVVAITTIIMNNIVLVIIAITIILIFILMRPGSWAASTSSKPTSSPPSGMSE